MPCRIQKTTLPYLTLIFSLAFAGCHDTDCFYNADNPEACGFESLDENQAMTTNLQRDEIPTTGVCDACTEPGEKSEEEDDCYAVESLAMCEAESVPRGLYVLVKWDKDARLEKRLLDLPFISGATVRAYWKDIEYEPGRYDWSKLDAHFAWASDAGKGVRLAIGTGVYAPDWLLRSTGNADTRCASNDTIETSAFGVQTFCASVRNGEYKTQRRSFPVAWDAVMYARWRMFLEALVAHLETSDASRSAAIDSLDWIAVTGPGSHNGEVLHPDADYLNLPLRHPVSHGPINTADDLLEALGFSWQRALDDFDSLFGARRIHYTLSFIFKSFPLGDGNQDHDALFKQDLLDYGRALPHAPYFGLQTNGLDDRALWVSQENWPIAKAHWKLVRNHVTPGEAFTGLQTRGMARLYGDGDKSSCGRRRVWNKIASNVKCLQVDVVEVYAPDVLAPFDDSCGGGVRAQLQELHAWLTR